MADERFRFTVVNRTSRDYWDVGPGSQQIRWISDEEPPKDPETIARRVMALRQGEEQWGHDGAHHGRLTDPECPLFLHHHHDFRCAMPTERECEMAEVPYRTRWGSRA